MPTRVKIGVIGAGSAQFSAGLVNDLCRTETLVNRKGIQPLHIGALPRKVMLEHVLPEWLELERQLQAFKSGDRSMLLWDLLDSRQTRSYDQAEAVLSDLLTMPGHEEMNAYFQFPPNW